MGISLKEVNFSYNPKRKGTKYALKDINLEISPSDEFIAIIGETGSGKSTLASLFNALKIPTSGEAYVSGIKIKKVRKRRENYNKIRKHVGLVFQMSDYQLFEETVLKDVMFAPLNFKKTKEEALKIAKSSLELVEIDESLFGVSPFTLSGGEKKLVSIAGILAMEPDILIFDEPTAGIDPSTKKKLLKLFRSLNEIKHKSVILITHDMNIVNEYAKRVILMKDGTISFDSSPYDLFVNNRKIVKDANIDLPDSYKIIDLLKEKTSVRFNENIKIKNLGNIVEELINE
ncbi:energy-coupling factor transporter ATPase [bacterium]|nr:energy-coupling factor transporter ATPase [bacterium]